VPLTPPISRATVMSPPQSRPFFDVRLRDD
jgi:hypothetical protein